MASAMPELDTKTRGTVVHAVLSGGPFRDECRLVSFESQSGRRHYQGIALSKHEAGVACVFSLPTVGHNIYVTVTAADQMVVRRVLADLEETEADSSVSLGNVLLLKAPELLAANIVGVLLLLPATSNMLNHLPLDLKVGEKGYRFLLVVFLTREEHGIWRTQGHDALMDFYSRSGKDLVACGDPRESH
jgi:hypothetical protein